MLQTFAMSVINMDYRDLIYNQSRILNLIRNQYLKRKI